MGFHVTRAGERRCGEVQIVNKKRCPCGAEISRKTTSGLCRACGTKKAHGDRAFTAEDDAILRKHAVGAYRTKDLQERFFPKRTTASIKARIDVLRTFKVETKTGNSTIIDASRRLFERQLATGQIASVPRMIEWHDRHNQSIAA